jgi:TetR/AcrR family transcriptional repressor of mexJK operon
MSNDPHKPLPLCAKTAGRPRASDVAARTNELIATAGHLFLEHGYMKVSLELIAREAHVAVRTIYVKFGGKAGLLQAVIEANRKRFFNLDQMDTDPRPLRTVITEFSRLFHDLITAPLAMSMQRMVLAEAPANPELAKAYFDAGPHQVREMLARYFARPEIRAQLRDDVALDLLPMHLLNCVMGDHFYRFLFEPAPQTHAEIMAALERRLELFFHGVLRAT